MGRAPRVTSSRSSLPRPGDVPRIPRREGEKEPPLSPGRVRVSRSVSSLMFPDLTSVPRTHGETSMSSSTISSLTPPSPVWRHQARSPHLTTSVPEPQESPSKTEERVPASVRRKGGSVLEANSVLLLYKTLCQIRLTLSGTICYRLLIMLLLARPHTD